MLILTSNGLSSAQLVHETRKYVKPGGKAAIVTTASVGYKEKDWHIPRITEEINALELSATCVDIETQAPQSLLDFDVVVINGGNPFYLLKQIRLQKAETVFRTIAEEKVLIGISAGSLVLQAQVELIARYSPEQYESILWYDFSGLGLTSLEILPHYDRFLTKFGSFEERAKAYEQEKNRSVILLNDGMGVFVLNSNYYIV